MDVLLAAFFVIPFSGVLYELVLFVARVSIVVVSRGFSIVLEVSFMRKYVWCGVCERETGNKLNKRQKRKTSILTENQ